VELIFSTNGNPDAAALLVGSSVLEIDMGVLENMGDLIFGAGMVVFDVMDGG
jgi:hypothetical protein